MGSERKQNKISVTSQATDENNTTCTTDEKPAFETMYKTEKGEQLPDFGIFV